MHVDGGKTLTSKGQQDWYGSLAMNRKYEQDSLAYYTNLFSSKPTEPRKPVVRDRNDLGQKEKLMDWVRDRQTSVWAGNDEELHIKVTSDYSNFIEDKDEIEHMRSQNADPIEARKV